MREIFELDQFSAPEPERNNLMIVDCLNLSFRYKHRGMPDFAGEYLATINSLAKSYGARTVILTADKGKSTFRKEILPEYKDNRKAAYENQTEEEKEKARLFFEGYERALELAEQKYPLIRMKGVEADDLSAYIVKNYSDDYEHVWLISSDADWDLLLSDKVSRFSFATRREYTLPNFFEEHECDNPEQYVSIKALRGDSGDGIPGIYGVGAKRAYNLVREHGSAMDLYDALPLPGKQVTIQNINNFKENILRNLQLVDLLSFCEDAIAHPDPENNLDFIRDFCGDNL